MNVRHILSLLLAVGLPATLAAQTRAPLFELGSLLDNVRVRPESGELWIDSIGHGSLVAAFLPDDVRNGTTQLWGALRSRPGGAVVAKFALLVEPMDERFSNIRIYGHSGELTARGFGSTHRIAQPGDYTFDLLIGENVVGRLPFSVVIKNTGDEFAPTRLFTVEGGWSEWGYLSMRMDEENPAVRFHCWQRKIDPAAPTRPLTVQVMYDGQVIGEGSPLQANSASWERYNHDIRAPRGKASGSFARNELFSRDGTYLFVLKHTDNAGTVDSVFRFHVSGGQVQPHARHASDFEPRLESILPRKWAVGPTDRRQTWWTERLTGAAATALLAEHQPKAVAGPSATTRGTWIAPVDPALANLPLTITAIAARHDTTLLAGDGIIVFGSGGYTGVGYAKVGDPVAQSIPGGTDFHAKLFAVCGKKIVLARTDRTLSVFDTASGTMITLDRAAATVSKLSGGPFQPATLTSDGLIAGVITEEAAVADRAAVKVLDLGGAQPVVISLRVPEGVLARNLNAVAVDAATGKIAVSSRDGRALYVGDIADGATLTKCDLSGHDGIAVAPIFIRGGFVLYRDDSGSSGRARLWDLAKNQVVTPDVEALPGSLRGLAINATHFAAAVEPSHGSTYRIARVALAGGAASYAADAGPGRGSSVAFLPDGLVAVGGSGSLGSDAYLHVRRADGRWVEVKGADGKPVAAGDVASFGPLLAFRTGRSTNVTLAYVSAATLATAE